MPHSESVTAVLTTDEPRDGTKLIVLSAGIPDDGWQADDAWRVIVRDDHSASNWDVNPDEHWFDGADGGKPCSLHAWVKDADAVYGLGEKLAQF